MAQTISSGPNTGGSKVMAFYCQVIGLGVAVSHKSINVSGKLSEYLLVANPYLTLANPHLTLQNLHFLLAWPHQVVFPIYSGSRT